MLCFRAGEDMGHRGREGRLALARGRRSYCVSTQEAERRQEVATNP